MDYSWNGLDRKNATTVLETRGEEESSNEVHWCHWALRGVEEHNATLGCFFCGKHNILTKKHRVKIQ
jgi:hypothetical protein